MILNGKKTVVVYITSATSLIVALLLFPPSDLRASTEIRGAVPLSSSVKSSSSSRSFSSSRSSPSDKKSSLNGKSQAINVESITLSNSAVSVVVDTETGGRISSLSVDGRELLYASPQVQQTTDNWGSTFWLSPQSLWGWPPVEEHDSRPYTVTALDKNSVTLTSQSGAGSRIVKRITVEGQNSSSSQSDQEQRQVFLNYTIQAEKDFSEVAAWEITRVIRSGLIVLPARQSSVNQSMGEVAYTHQGQEDDVLWIKLNPDEQPPEGKMTANGREGWLAWINQGLLYAKVYPPVDLDDMATGEGDLEVYLSGNHPYVELEVQSAAQTLPAGEQLSWKVNWLIRRVPKDLDVSVGNEELLVWIRKQVFPYLHPQAD